MPAAKKPYSYVSPDPPAATDISDEPRKSGVAKLDASTVDSRILVLLAACMLAKLLDQSNFVYVPSLRGTQVKTTLLYLPELLFRVQTLRKDVTHELAKALRVGPKRYLKQAMRELAGLFAEG